MIKVMVKFDIKMLYLFTDINITILLIYCYHRLLDLQHYDTDNKMLILLLMDNGIYFVK